MAADSGETGYPIDGLSGKLYGETGWDTLTSDALWPFPNEDQIKTDVAAFSMDADEAYAGSPAMVGARGFATAGDQTLTKYIWEYLGNTIPSSIYDSSSSISIPGNLSISSGQLSVH